MNCVSIEYTTTYRNQMDPTSVQLSHCFNENVEPFLPVEATHE